MSGLPGHITIGPSVFAVRYEPNPVRELEVVDGLIDYAKRRIVIEVNMHPEHQHQVLWHEILHGLLTQGGFANHDEQMVTVLAIGIQNVLLRNPQLRDLDFREWKE